MEDARFDAFARSLANARSRRAFARLLGGLALAAPLSLLDRAGAAKKKKKKKKFIICDHGRTRTVPPKGWVQRYPGATPGPCPAPPPPPASPPPPPPCTPQCNGRDCGPDGCGGLCGTCEGTALCSAGRCVPTCPEGERPCRSDCIPATDCCSNSECSGGRICQSGSCACGQAAAPHWCAAASACVPACPTGMVFDPALCTCDCIERSCCQCTGGSNPFCDYGYASFQRCSIDCSLVNPGGTSNFSAGVVDGRPRTVTCSAAGRCDNVTCFATDFCSGADACKGGTVQCSGGRSCFQPLGGGPTRCGKPTVTTSCGCTSHQQCANAHGAGAFCAQITGSACSCQGATSFCVTA